jgi:hypothetical protein
LPGELALILGPTPARGPVHVWFEVPKDEWVSVCLFNSLGRRVVTLVSGLEAAGRHEVSWDGTVRGKRRAGVYSCRITAENESRESSILVLK